MNALLPSSLSNADRVFCFSGGIDGSVAQALEPLGQKATVHDHLGEMVDAIVAYLQAGDQLVVMSNGDVRRHPREATGAARRAR